MKTITWMTHLPRSIADLVRNGIDVERRSRDVDAVLDLQPGEREAVIKRAGEISHFNPGWTTQDVLDGMYELACLGVTAGQLLAGVAEYERLWETQRYRRLGLLDPAKDPLTQAERDLEIPR